MRMNCLNKIKEKIKYIDKIKKIMIYYSQTKMMQNKQN